MVFTTTPAFVTATAQLSATRPYIKSESHNPDSPKGQTVGANRMRPVESGVDKQDLVLETNICLKSSSLM
jgi:hypothetical protein